LSGVSPERELIDVLEVAIQELRNFINIWNAYSQKEGYDDVIYEAIDKKLKAVRKAAYALLEYLYIDSSAEDIFYKLLLT